MFGMGGSEIIVILIVALLFLGPEKLPSAAKQISKGIRDIKKQSRSLQQQIENDDQIGGAIRDLKSALRGDEVPVKPKPVKARKPKELPAGENSILPPSTAPGTPAEAAPAELAAAHDAAAEGPAPEATETSKVTLPATAGEPDADAPVTEGDDEDLAAMVRPAAGTVAKGSEPKHG
ncbi:MAG: twin-arginine translocase TatA/TatE family subunit [Myxococcales bacterium]|nr:twin-arginine translocase TatA/TatE family subunit [Myxococcales bacterium]